MSRELGRERKRLSVLKRISRDEYFHKKLVSMPKWCLGHKTYSRRGFFCAPRGVKILNYGRLEAAASGTSAMIALKTFS